jgi:hypothetical protein
MKKWTILDITDWYEDTQMEAGDASHMGEGDVMRAKLDEYERKIEGGEWPGLPFTCEARDADDAIQKYNDKFCDYDYYKATDADFADDGEEPEEE